MSVINLAYVGLGVADVAAWTRFGVDILDLEDAGPQTGGSRLLRFDDHAPRIALHPNPVNDIIYSGYSVDSARAVDRIANIFIANGDEVRAMTPAQLDARYCKGGIILKDPDGLDVEVVHGLEQGETYKSAHGTHFVTGDLGLGHIVLSASDIERTLAFYEKLGFEITDYIEFVMGPAGRVRLVFLHCNERHHTLALLPLAMPRRLNHLMFEVTSTDSVLRSYYRALEAHVPIARHIGRHTNDKMLSFYAQTPAGFDVEYGCEGVRIEADWKIVEYDAISIWGHNPP
jgi:biphenyl-2,3-diol 1,2-dioxygenase